MATDETLRLVLACLFAQAELSKALLSSKLEQAIRASSAVSEEPLVLERCGKSPKAFRACPLPLCLLIPFSLCMVAFGDFAISPFQRFVVVSTNEQG